MSLQRVKAPLFPIFKVLQEFLVGVVQRSEAEELSRSDRDCLLVFVKPASLSTRSNVLGHGERDSRELIALIIEDIERLRRLHDEPIQIAEHLLDPRAVLVGKEQDRNALFAESRILGDRMRDGRAAVLAVVDDKVRIFELHLENAEILAARGPEFDWALIADAVIEANRYPSSLSRMYLAMSGIRFLLRMRCSRSSGVNSAQSVKVNILGIAFIFMRVA